jgi:3-oxoacyl-[acyl-carrier-protein] synthase II
VAAARLAAEDAGLTGGAVDPQRFGVVYGASTQPGELAELGPAAVAAAAPDRDCIDLAEWGAHGLPLIPPTWLLNVIPNIAAAHVSILNNARGPVNTVTQSDAAGVLAIGEAARVIRRGRADAMLAGGADTKLFPAHASRFNLMAALSRRNDEPERACRPFDRDRDGSVLAEGAGFLLLEERRHAERRGTGAGLGRVAGQAMAVAGIGHGQLDHVNAHGYGCPVEDAREARGIAAAAPAEVLAVKSYVGNLGAAAGAVELAASLLALDRGVVPATLNYERPDPECPVDVLRVPRALARDCVLKLGFTPLGQCGAVVVRRAR